MTADRNGAGPSGSPARLHFFPGTSKRGNPFKQSRYSAAVTLCNQHRLHHDTMTQRNASVASFNGVSALIIEVLNSFITNALTQLTQTDLCFRDVVFCYMLQFRQKALNFGETCFKRNNDYSVFQSFRFQKSPSRHVLKQNQNTVILFNMFFFPPH